MATPAQLGLPSEIGIKALGHAALSALLRDLGQPSYRSSQILKWLYGCRVRSFDEMTNLPADLRASLAGRLPLP